MTDIQLEYMIEAYNVKFEELQHFSEVGAFLGSTIKMIAKKSIKTIVLALSVIFSIIWVGEKASDKVVNEIKEGREKLKNNAKETSGKIAKFAEDVSNTAKELQTEEGQRWLVRKTKIIVKAMLAFIRKAGRFVISVSGWDNLSAETRAKIHKLWTLNINALKLATKTSVAIGTIMAVIYLAYKLIKSLNQKDAEKVESDLKKKSNKNMSLAKKTVHERNIRR